MVPKNRQAKLITANTTDEPSKRPIWNGRLALGTAAAAMGVLVEADNVDEVDKVPEVEGVTAEEGVMGAEEVILGTKGVVTDGKVVTVVEGS